MKVYVQDTENGCYFQSPFVWVKEQAAAYDFVTSLEAFDFCLQNEGRGTRILLAFDDPRQTVCLFTLNDNCPVVKPALPATLPKRAFAAAA